MLLELHNLAKSFPSPAGPPRRIIDIPHFSLDTAEQVALVGSSGSGKTTLLHLIAGIIRPDAGSIVLHQTNLPALSEASLDRFRARHVGYVFQTFNLLQSFTALQNVELALALGTGHDRPRAIDLLTHMGLADHLHHLPRQLSVGQQQRVAVARALANRPRLVLADEPTGNLDPSTAQTALSLIRSACREHGSALLIVSHDPAVLAQFDRVESLAALNRAASSSPAPQEPAP